MPSLEEVASEHHNYDRARAFGGPVFRYTAPGALLLGYSVTSRDEDDVLIEATHVVETGSGNEDPQPAVVRTRIQWDDADVEWENDMLDTLMTHRIEDVSSERQRLLAAIAQQPRQAVKLEIDDRTVDADAVDIGTIRFVRAVVDEALVTAAGPRSVVDAPLTGNVPA